MTLVVGLISNTEAFLATDRLITLQRRGGHFAGQHDELSNKNVVLLADDGVAVLGYTGSAYIGDIPTDRFIAEVLYGEDIPPGSMMGNRQRRMGGGISDRLFHLRNVTSANWGFGLVRILAIGFRRYGRFVWPFEVCFDLGAISMGGDRMFLRARPPVGRRLTHVGAALTQAEVAAAYEQSTFSRTGRLQSAPDFLACLIRNKAAVDRTVGRDVMQIHIDAYKREISCRFSAERQDDIRTPAPVDPVTSCVVAYTPWVVSRRTVIAPSLMASPQPLELSNGVWTAKLYGADPAGGDLTLLLQGQPRQPPP